MNIVLDLDGVLANFAGAYDRMFGGKLDVPHQDIPDAHWKAIDKAKTFWLDMPVLPGGHYLASLGEMPENIYILTSRKTKTMTDTQEWFKRHKIDIPASRILFANPRSEKVRFLEGLAPAAFLDDSISNVDFCNTIYGVEATLMLQSYNAACAIKYFPTMRATNSVQAYIEGILK